ncbi:hypothetical protein BU14_0176s0015 [Porphyra umbilicalis]|uniref:Uncharacterized protein n=1 Tax=Porphyra umbilicalis TaxID=2786 RepID=A0A1X6P7A1_PORUM|nr:hypothetical protein BU14_0176s0015 [Porphyra umbilicalis]|eukprot:OSX76772.1 hypothetical protein BU14_0176s0015 [Porphyra umbilicalis]
MPSSRLLLTHPDYYSWPLEARRDHLGASAVSCLCKSILLVNTRCTREDCEDLRNPKHLMVVVPYGRKLNTQEVLRWSKARAPAGISGKNFNWRLGDGAAVTGYEYNAVTPLGSQSAVPIVVDESLVAAHGGVSCSSGGEGCSSSGGCASTSLWPGRGGPWRTFRWRAPRGRSRGRGREATWRCCETVTALGFLGRALPPPDRTMAGWRALPRKGAQSEDADAETMRTAACPTKIRI